MSRAAKVIGVGARAALAAALARRFARECLHVFVAVRDARRIDALAHELCVSGGAATAVATDATQPGDIARLFDAELRAVAHGMARELGLQGLHVAHVVIDGAIDGDQLNRRIPQLKERLGPDGMLAPDAIADAYWQLHVQPRSAWTLELDLRPFKESF